MILATAAILALAACGKVGSPTPPGPADKIIFPQTYPAQ
jgi:hypothetical protein